MKLFSLRNILLFIFLIIIVAGFCIPQNFSMPVLGAGRKDYNPKSFWFYPWGKSVTHKGVDIFASEGTQVNAPVSGYVLYSGTIEMGGNVVLLLGPKWRLHYFAHLNERKVSTFQMVHRSECIGSVGQSGNAAGKPPHLHYSISTLIPYFWRIDFSKQGWKKMFFLNPIDYLDRCISS
jgi:peptidoglycan LD-endopeptidase LytH